MPALKKGDKGAAVKRLQESLMRLSYDLPKFGADGDLGDETLKAVMFFRRDHSGTVVGDNLPGSVPANVYDAVIAAAESVAAATAARPPNFLDIREHATIPIIGPRSWRSVTGITLHQTAVFMSENPPRWYGVHCHVGVLRNGSIYYVNDLNEAIVHGNLFNASEVGIEINGQFEGVEDDPTTFWKPSPTAQPQKPSNQQIEAARAAVKWICDEVASHGGRIRNIHAHRQSSKDRRGDPGSRIWRDVGIWAQNSLGLSDGGEGFKVGSGRPIPQKWDPRYSSAY